MGWFVYDFFIGQVDLDGVARREREEAFRTTEFDDSDPWTLVETGCESGVIILCCYWSCQPFHAVCIGKCMVPSMKVLLFVMTSIVAFCSDLLVPVWEFLSCWPSSIQLFQLFQSCDRCDRCDLRSEMIWLCGTSCDWGGFHREHDSRCSHGCLA